MHRRLAISIFLVASVFAQVPADDIRNLRTPNTDTHFQMPEYRTLREWETRRSQLRWQILAAAGLLPLPPRTPLRPQIFGRIERGDHSIEKVLIQTMPGFYLGGNLYRPLGRKGRFPGILTPHGHWKHGRLENTEQVSVPGRCITLARQGYVVFSYDMVGYNDTVQMPHKFGGKAEELWGFGPLGLQLWNSMRALDFLQSLPDVDESRIGVTGASGGGTQTFLLAAVDRRVKAAVPVNMVSAIMQGGCECENAPGLRVGTFNVEFAAMMAPRPLLLIAATGDWTKNVPREEYPAIRKIYELYGKAENVEYVQMNAGHNYNKDSREAMYRFFAKHLLRNASEISLSEPPFEVPPDSAMRALSGKELPTGALDPPSIFTRWKEMTVPARSSRFTRFVLSTYLGTEWPRVVYSDLQGEKLVLSREGRQDRVPGLWLNASGVGRATLVVHPEGAAAARKMAPIARLIQSGQPVLLIDAFQTGTAKAARDRSHKFFLTFNQSDDAARVQDILTAIRFLRGEKRVKGIDVIGIHDAGIWCLFAAAVSPVNVRLFADLDGFQGADQDFIDHFFVPGIQRAGGLEAALKLVRPNPWITK